MRIPGLLLITGVLLAVAKVNAWFIVPDWCMWICVVFGVLTL